MIDALHIAETGLNTYSTYLDVISNNIANINTPGFKKTGVNFTDMVYKDSWVDQGISVDSLTYVPRQVGMGTSINSTFKVFSDGQMVQTGNPMDIAISGSGFIEVELPDGTLAYTRAGRLSVDKEGFLNSAEGYRLTSNIQLPPDTEAFAISNEGLVMVKLAGDDELMELGTIELARFMNPESLNAIGSNLYSRTEEAGEVVSGTPGENGTGMLIQGFQEISNVNLTQEMVNMMTAQRAFQLNSRVVQVADQMLETINNMRR
ncbi:MAG: flagellar basal-body rod protein FlgG [Kangiellaceae bacterium]|nr:flagellar basal-body rod protein FlgG [Kangiellaceae bacterium]MCW8999448.1 flagellar basal-body rod protein FlgG [Kangiellaceae bacterium]MCW9016478.1 flagellar basal-body rod protein FlgG [Kangiellaceae bacterium]